MTKHDEKKKWNANDPNLRMHQRYWKQVKKLEGVAKGFEDAASDPSNKPFVSDLQRRAHEEREKIQSIIVRRARMAKKMP